MKTFNDLARDLRADRELLESVAVDFATTHPGDWDTLIERLAARGYDVPVETLRKRLTAGRQPHVAHTDFIARWI